MKKKFALVLFLIMIFYSIEGKATNQRWVPKYQKQELAKPKVPIPNPIIDKSAEIKKGTVTQTQVAKHDDLEEEQMALLSQFKLPIKGAMVAKVKEQAYKLSGKAIPALLKVMRDGAYPDDSRWLATFLTGRIMGKKAAPFMAKYTEHPNWVLRLASLKVLMALDQRDFKGVYARLLKDKALIIRVQALETINKFNLTDLAPYVWAMLYDENNYKGNKGKRERTDIIKKIILTIGSLKFEKAKKPMLAMIKDKKYKDIHGELDQALSLLSDKKSPKGSIDAKRYFWEREDLKAKTI